MRAVVAGLLLATAWLAEPRAAVGLSVQEAILRAKPAVALVTAEIRADVTMNCGQGPVEVSPAPFIETGTGWFVDGRGFLITNAHVVDPAHRLPPWVTHELKKKAIEQACVEPALRARGLIRGQRPEVEEQIRRQASDVGLATAKVAPLPKITVMLSNGAKLPAEVRKFSPPLLLDSNNRPLADSGRDLALLRVKDGVYPTIALSKRDSQIGDPVHILGFPGVVLSHELLNKSAALEASVTNGAVSGFQQDQIGQSVIQSDAHAAHGNSGGPAVTDDATVVGVMTFISLSSSGSEVQGFNFLIPAKDVAKFLEGTEVTKPGESAFNPVWGAGIECSFLPHLNVDQFLRHLAVHTITSNLDSILCVGHNYFLYLNPTDDKFYFIPWDLNLSFAGWVWLGSPEDLINLSISHPHVSDNKLIERLLAIDSYNQIYHRHISDLLATVCGRPAIPFAEGIAGQRLQLAHAVDAKHDGKQGNSRCAGFEFLGKFSHQ